MVEGNLVITNLDGSEHRCVAGDTVVTPRGWSGHWDVVGTARAIRVGISQS